MRFKKPSFAEADEVGRGGCSRDIEDGGAAAFCVPADGVHCAGCRWDAGHGDGVCWSNDCDALFTPGELRRQQREWPADASPQLVITAGPERSGSTWLYNAVRLLFQHARLPLDAYWLKDVTDEALAARGVGQAGAHHVLVKTHAWSDAFDLGRATHVFVTHRDLRQVLASFRRMAWEFHLPGSYVEHHLKWREAAELDIGFEEIISEPEALLRNLAARLGLQVDIASVLHDLCNLPVPKDWVDPVTQIWPSHISSPYDEARRKAAAAARGGGGGGAGGRDGAAGDDEASGSLEDAMGAGMHPGTPTMRKHVGREEADQLVQRFPEYFELYNYA